MIANICYIFKIHVEFDCILPLISFRDILHGCLIIFFNKQIIMDENLTTDHLVYNGDPDRNFDNDYQIEPIENPQAVEPNFPTQATQNSSHRGQKIHNLK